MKAQNIFVTGGSGFIGANLVRELTKQGKHVTALLREHAQHPFLEQCEIRQVKGDIFQQIILDKEIQKCDAVIHLAAAVSFNERERREIYHTNVTGTENAAKYAYKHQKRMVFVSTAATIGAPSKEKKLMDETAPFIFEKTSSYAHAKYLAERVVLQYVKKGLDAVIVNPSTVYGAGDLHGTGPSFYKLMEEKPIFVAPPGGCSVIAVSDVVSGICAALEKGKAGERYILTKENIFYKELFNIIKKSIYGRSLLLLTIPSFVEPIGRMLLKKINLQSAIITPSVLSNLFKWRWLNNAKAIHELAWRPAIPIEQAIQEGYLFYQQQKD